MMTHVLLVKTPLPTGHAYTNTQEYEGRGWCFAEMLMSSIVKDDTALIDLVVARRPDEDTDYAPPPEFYARFATLLEERFGPP